MKISIAGATGLLGRAIAERSLAAGHEVKCLVRPWSESKAADLAMKGAEIVWGDVGKPQALDKLCRGAEVVISTVTSTMSQDPSDTIARIDAAGNIALIECAERNGVDKFIFLSFPLRPREFPLQSAKRTVEARLAHSSLDWTVLQVPLLMEVWLTPLSGFDWRSGRVRFIGDGKARLSWISIADVAGCVLERAESRGAGRRVIVVPGGGEASLEEIAAQFEQATGRSFGRERVPVEVIEAEFERSSEPKQKSFLAVCLDLAHGFVVQAPDLPTSSGLRLETYVSSVLHHTASTPRG